MAHPLHYVPKSDRVTEPISTPIRHFRVHWPLRAGLAITRVYNNTANIVFTSLTTNGITFLMADGGTADLNVNGAYPCG